MSENPADGPDRRDFMVGSLAAVGAAASLAATADGADPGGIARAREARPSPATRSMASRSSPRST